MDQDEKVIFAELDRGSFALIVAALAARFDDIQYGSQCDDWIWIERGGMKVEIDSFYSMQLELKGPRRAFGLLQEILALMRPEWIVAGYAVPKPDLTA